MSEVVVKDLINKFEQLANQEISTSEKIVKLDDQLQSFSEETPKQISEQTLEEIPKQISEKTPEQISEQTTKQISEQIVILTIPQQKIMMTEEFLETEQKQEELSSPIIKQKQEELSSPIIKQKQEEELPIQKTMLSQVLSSEERKLQIEKSRKEIILSLDNLLNHFTTNPSFINRVFENENGKQHSDLLLDCIINAKEDSLLTMTECNYYYNQFLQLKK